MSKKPRTHCWHYATRRWFPWLYCCKCGLVLIKNEATARAARKPCDSDLDE